MQFQAASALLALLVTICHALPVEEQKCTGENEVYQSCGTACPETCLTRSIANRVCIMMCKSGCFCASGYVRLGYDAIGGAGQCVPVSRCASIPMIQTNINNSQ